jgi:hypothetical protein
VLRTFAADGVFGEVAVLARDALILVRREGGTEFERRIAVGVRIAVRADACDTVLRALAVDSVGAVSAVGACDALVLGVGLVAAELGLVIAAVVAVTVRAKLRLAVGRALLVDRVLVVAAVVARHALVLVVGHVRTELTRLVAVVVSVAVRTSVRDAVLGAVLVDGLLAACAELARNA